MMIPLHIKNVKFLRRFFDPPQTMMIPQYIMHCLLKAFFYANFLIPHDDDSAVYYALRIKKHVLFLCRYFDPPQTMMIPQYIMH